MPTETPILVAEDEPAFRQLLTAQVEAAGYAVVGAATGAEGLALCRRLRIDLAIADWMMPELDGVELCRALKADPALRPTYVILLTGRDALPDKVRALDAGADEYLVKPCADEELLARVRAGLRIRRLQDELAAMEWRLATRELAAALGHAINDPLGAVASSLERAAREALLAAGGPAGALVAEAQREVGRIAAVIRRVVTLRDPRRISSPLGEPMTDLGDRA